MPIISIRNLLCRLLATLACSAVPLCAACGLAPQDPLLQTPGPGTEENEAGIQVLTRGPVHEAFAEPVVYDPKASAVILKAPPAPVEEVPPDEKPDGTDVQWIPGYWAWDDTREDFLWVSGIWREPPPGRQWVPGYWNPVGNGFQWVPGAWTPIEEEQAEYLPEPPASLEVGPNIDAPDQNSIWAPGCWYWQQTRYAWRPGYWVRPQLNWVWIPAHYVWTPSGYLFIDGYWDRPIARRGCLFAPVYFSQPVYARPRFVYRPTITILATALTTSLFIRPAQTAYYFGDYYDQSYSRRGYYPWYAFHQSRYGYDPIYSHYSAIEMRTNPNWNRQIREVYTYRRDHIQARPPHTYVQQTNLIQQNNINVNQINTVVNNTNVNNITVNNIVNNVVVARPIKQVAATPQNPVKFVAVDRGRQDQYVKRAQEVRTFQQQRVRRESELKQNFAAHPQAAQRVKTARSPIIAAMAPTPADTAHTANPAEKTRPAPNTKASPVPGSADGMRPPARPNLPRVDPKAIAKKQQSRPEPNPDRPTPPARPGPAEKAQPKQKAQPRPAGKGANRPVTVPPQPPTTPINPTPSPVQPAPVPVQPQPAPREPNTGQGQPRTPAMPTPGPGTGPRQKAQLPPAKKAQIAERIRGDQPKSAGPLRKGEQPKPAPTPAPSPAPAPEQKPSGNPPGKP